MTRRVVMLATFAALVIAAWDVGSQLQHYQEKEPTMNSPIGTYTELSGFCAGGSASVGLPQTVNCHGAASGTPEASFTATVSGVSCGGLNGTKTLNRGYDAINDKYGWSGGGGGVVYIISCTFLTSGSYAGTVNHDGYYWVFGTWFGPYGPAAVLGEVMSGSINPPTGTFPLVPAAGCSGGQVSIS
jgi:hypothetical protein